MKKAQALSLVVFLFLAITLTAQNARTVYSINSNWKFHKGDVSQKASSENTNQWQPVSIPHTWNTKDAFDDTLGYYRGIGVYKKSIFFLKL